MNRAKRLYDEAESIYCDAYDRYTNIARNQGLEPELALIDWRYSGELPDVDAPAPPPTQSTPPTAEQNTQAIGAMQQACQAMSPPERAEFNKMTRRQQAEYMRRKGVLQ